MPTILLVRHAKPDFDTRKMIRGDELGRTIEQYDAARLATCPGPCELIAYANKEEPVVLVGHGLFNRFIGSRLKALGWTKQRDEGNAFGSWQCYRA